MDENRRIADPVWLTRELDEKWTLDFIDYLYDCKANGKDALLILSGVKAKNIYMVVNIAETLRQIDVNLITVGYGFFGGIASTSLFFQGDERILMPGAGICLTNVNEKYAELFLAKTNISLELFKDKTYWTELCWIIESKDWNALKITTKEYSDILPFLIRYYFNNAKNNTIPFKFAGDLISTLTKEILEYIYTCAAFNREAFFEINSNGGDANCLETILSTLEITRVKATTIGGGCVASAAATFFLMGDRRFLKDNTLLVIHEARTYMKDQKLFQLEARCREKILRMHNEKIVDYCTRKTKITKKECRQQINRARDWEITKKEDVEKFAITTHTYEEILQEIINIRRKS